MPDPNQPLGSTQKPLGSTSPITSVSPVVVEEKPPKPVMGAGTLPPPPPMMGGTPPPPPPSIIGGPKPKKKPDKKVEPTVAMSPDGKPKKKKRKIIATILVLLVLVVGGVSATILVRQQQDIRERADDVHGDLCAAVWDGTCVPDDWVCGNAFGTFGCGSGNKCGTNCSPPPAPLPGPTCSQSSLNICGGECPTGERCIYTLGLYVCEEDSICSCINDCLNQGHSSNYCSNTCGTQDTDPVPICQNPGDSRNFGTISGGLSVNITDEMINYCDGCENAGRVKVSRFQCSGQTMPAGGCQQGGQIAYITSAQTYTMANDCGPQQLDVGCEGGGSIQWVSAVNWPATCGAGGNGGNGNGDIPETTLTSQCTEVKAFDSEDNVLTAEDLANLAVGDVVKFAVRGSASSGSITKARFTINGTLRSEITGKQTINSVSYYVDTYTIPAGVTSFTIKAELYHPTAGWF